MWVHVHMGSKHAGMNVHRRTEDRFATLLASISLYARKPTKALRMQLFLAMFLTIANLLVQTSVCATIGLWSKIPDKSLSSTTVDLLTSFTDCIIYIFDWGLKNENSYSLTEYIRHYSGVLNCAVEVDTFFMYGNSSVVNPRFENLKAHPLFTKHTNTLISLYPSATATTSIDLKNITATNDIYTAIFWYNIPFNYILIFMSKDKFSCVQNAGWVSRFIEISSPAIFMIVLDKNSVNVVGFAHALRSGPCLFRAQSFQKEHIQELHKTIHKDLQGATARIRTLKSLKKCRFGELLMMHPNYCAANAMAEHFNTTILNTNDHPLPRLSIAQMYVRVAINHFSLQKLSRKTESNFETVNSAILYEDASFVCIIAEKNKIGLKALAQAYDLLTWTVTVTVSMLLAATIAVMAENTPSSSYWTRLLSALPVVLMLLIERFYEHGKVIRAASRQIILVITLWAFGAMLLGTCYSGNMVSQLTSPSLPTCPQNLGQLVEVEEYPVLTDAFFMYDKVPLSLFHKQIAEYSEKFCQTNNSYVSTLRRFGKTLTFVDDTVRLNPANYNSSGQVLFSYAGRTQEVKSLGMWSVMHGRNIRVLDGGNLPHFTVRSPLLLQTNSLWPIIQRFMAGYCDCGIWNHWMHRSMAATAREEFQYYAQTGQKEVPQMLARISTIAAIWRNFDPMIDGERSCSPLTLDNLNAAFSFLGIGLLLSLCVIIKEKGPWHAVVYQLVKLGNNVNVFMRGSLQDLATSVRMQTSLRSLVLRAPDFTDHKG